MKNEKIPTISICTIVKNEENQIQGFLFSLVDFADEIIVVDTGSSDRTLAIIADFAGRHEHIKLYAYSYEGKFHYGIAKNFSIRQATKDFIIILDADERLSDEFKENIRDFLKKEDPVVAKVKRVDDYISHLVDHPERIIENHQQISYKTDESGRVHERLDHSQEVKEFYFTLWHCQRWNHYVWRPQRILFQLELQIERVPRTKSFLGHCMRGVWYFVYRFKKLFIHRQLYKDGVAGFKYSFIRALDAFFIELFAGLKPKKEYKYWEDPNYQGYKDRI